ncbi:MFS transporter [Candidatus Pacearchaeota archaeon]|nr:MFS transporter [Candidatus Pacearchaeota archaeon]
MNLKINKIVKYLILSDLVFFSGWGLITPIFAIFIMDNIQGGTIIVAGIASSIYWILKSVLRVPIGMFLDNHKGDKDDYFFLVIGLLIAALVPFGYIFSKLPWHIYVLQTIYAIGMGMSLSGWAAIFTRHIDKGKEATEWGLDATAYGIGMGITAAIGGLAVTQFGFNSVFVAVGVMGLIGVALLLCIRNKIKGVFDYNHFNLKEIFKEK